MILLRQPEVVDINFTASSSSVRDVFRVNRPYSDTKEPYTLSEKVVYVYLIPSVATVGILGNLAVAVLLMASKTDEAGRRVKRFSGFMYEYMKGIAVLDTLYLVFSLQVWPALARAFF